MVLEAFVQARMTQLLKDSAYYQNQVKKALVGKPRFPRVINKSDVLMIDQDEGALFVCIMMQSLPRFRVPVDGGLGVCIMIEARPTRRILSMANGVIVVE